MSLPPGRGFVLGAVAAISFALGGALGFFIRGPEQQLGGPAPAERQADGSLVIAREPGAHIGKPPHALPPGGREERRVEVTLIPAAAALCQAGQPPAPLRLSLSLVRLRDGSARVVASSPDGTVSGGLDVPLEAGPASLARPWAAGVSWAGGQAIGVWAERSLWRLRLGLDVNQATDGGAEARVRLGWAFGG